MCQIEIIKQIKRKNYRCLSIKSDHSGYSPLMNIKSLN